MIELIIFDCDGVIMDSEVIAASSSAAIKAEFGYNISIKEHIRKFCGVSNDDEEKQAMKSQLPYNYSEIALQRTIENFRKHLKPIPNIKETLSSLTLPYCLASNSSNAKIDVMMEVTNILPYFKNSIFSSEQVKRGKPAPDIYLHAAKIMGVAPEKCLVIEDSIAGATAGLNANMNVVGFLGGSHQVYLDNNSKLRNLGIQQIFDDMTNLQQIIDNFIPKTV